MIKLSLTFGVIIWLDNNSDIIICLYVDILSGLDDTVTSFFTFISI
jgi:hypothetical protein